MENQDQIPKPPEIQELPKKIGVVHTYAEDMAHAVEGIHGGEIKRLIQKDSEFKDEEVNLSPESKKNKMLMVLSAVLIIATVVIVFLVVKINSNSNTVVPIQKSESIIYTDKTQLLPIDNLTKDEIIKSINAEVSATDVKSGAIEAIYLTENNRSIGFSRFAELLQLNIPAEISSYTDENFLIGAYNGNTKSFFILMKVKSFTDIFPGFKLWEDKMFFDLHSLFGTEINVDTKDLLTKDFSDTIIANKNARTLFDKDNKSIVEYVYANETSVVIISNDETANEIMLRLSTGNIAK